jgi:hypothetical protein
LAIPQAGGDISNPRTAVQREDLEAAGRSAPKLSQDEVASAGMLGDVGAGFGDGEGNFAGEILIEPKRVCHLGTGASGTPDMASIFDGKES